MPRRVPKPGSWSSCRLAFYDRHEGEFVFCNYWTWSFFSSSIVWVNTSTNTRTYIRLSVWPKAAMGLSASPSPPPLPSPCSGWTKMKFLWNIEKILKYQKKIKKYPPLPSPCSGRTKMKWSFWKVSHKSHSKQKHYIASFGYITPCNKKS